MSFIDAQMSDVTVVLDKRYESRLAEAIEMLKQAGLDVRTADDDRGLIEGVIEAQRAHDLQKLDAVDYVRITFTWVADYPVGDPRDKDLCAREYDEVDDVL
jgi:hypothetical protein